ncbi:MAG: hypothetical protein ABSG16_08755 [Candidatus Acidiferrum sp.]
MQRDVAIEIMKLFGTTLRTVGKFRDLATYWNYIADEKKKVTKEQEKEAKDELVKAQGEMLEHLAIYWQLGEVSRLVFSSKVQAHLEEVREGYHKMLNAIWAYEMISAETYGPSMEKIMAKEEALAAAIRNELGFDSNSALS